MALFLSASTTPGPLNELSALSSCTSLPGARQPREERSSELYRPPPPEPVQPALQSTTHLSPNQPLLPGELRAGAGGREGGREEGEATDQSVMWLGSKGWSLPQRKTPLQNVSTFNVQVPPHSPRKGCTTHLSTQMWASLLGPLAAGMVLSHSCTCYRVGTIPSGCAPQAGTPAAG